MMQSLFLTLGFTMLLLLAAGCDPPRSSKAFQFAVLNFHEEFVPCMIVIDDDWAEAAERMQFVNLEHNRPLVLEMPGDASEITVTVAPLLRSDPTRRVPKSAKEARDISGYLEEVRRLRRTDPDRQLFIMGKRAI